MPASIVNSALLYGDPELQLNISSMIKKVSLDDIANYGSKYIEYEVIQGERGPAAKNVKKA